MNIKYLARKSHLLESRFPGFHPLTLRLLPPRSLIMLKSLTIAFVSAALLAGAGSVFAREGARSVGKGIKCYYNSQIKAQVCYKGV